MKRVFSIVSIFLFSLICAEIIFIQLLSQKKDVAQNAVKTAETNQGLAEQTGEPIDVTTRFMNLGFNKIDKGFIKRVELKTVVQGVIINIVDLTEKVGDQKFVYALTLSAESKKNSFFFSRPEVSRMYIFDAQTRRPLNLNQIRKGDTIQLTQVVDLTKKDDGSTLFTEIRRMSSN